MVEWLKAADCKSARVSVRRFKSYPLHHIVYGNRGRSEWVARIVAAGALVTPGKIVKEGELWAGSPAKLFRTISQQEVSEFLSGAEGYRKLAQEYRAALD